MTFKTLVNTKFRCFKCEEYEHYDYQCPSESQHVKTVPTDDVDDSKVIEEVHVPSKTLSIIEDTSVCADTLVNNEIYMSSDSASNDVDEIVESNTTIMPSKPFESPCAEYSFMVVSINSSFRGHLNFLPKSNRWLLILLLRVVQSLSESHIPLSLDVCPFRHVRSLILL